MRVNSASFLPPLPTISLFLYTYMYMKNHLYKHAFVCRSLPWIRGGVSLTPSMDHKTTPTGRRDPRRGHNSCTVKSHHSPHSVPLYNYDSLSSCDHKTDPHAASMCSRILPDSQYKHTSFSHAWLCIETSQVYMCIPYCANQAYLSGCTNSCHS